MSRRALTMIILAAVASLAAAVFVGLSGRQDSGPTPVADGRAQSPNGGSPLDGLKVARSEDTVESTASPPPRASDDPPDQAPEPVSDRQRPTKTPVRAPAPASAPASAPDPAKDDTPEGTRGDGKADGKAEPGVYDPLGTGAEHGDLSPTQKGRARVTASNYVLYAYGFSGRGEKDFGAYDSNLAHVIIPERLDESPGAKIIQDYGESILADGVDSQATMTAWQLEKENLQTVVGTAAFEVRASSGPLEAGRYEQRLKLQSWSNVYRVAAAERPKRVG